MAMPAMPAMPKCCWTARHVDVGEDLASLGRCSVRLRLRRGQPGAHQGPTAEREESPPSGPYPARPRNAASGMPPPPGRTHQQFYPAIFDLSTPPRLGPGPRNLRSAPSLGAPSFVSSASFSLQNSSFFSPPYRTCFPFSCLLFFPGGPRRPAPRSRHIVEKFRGSGLNSPAARVRG